MPQACVEEGDGQISINAVGYDYSPWTVCARARFVLPPSLRDAVAACVELGDRKTDGLELRVDMVDAWLRANLVAAGATPMCKEMDGAPYFSLISCGASIKSTLLLLEPDAARRIAMSVDFQPPDAADFVKLAQALWPSVFGIQSVEAAISEAMLVCDRLDEVRRMAARSSCLCWRARAHLLCVPPTAAPSAHRTFPRLQTTGVRAVRSNRLRRCQQRDARVFCGLHQALVVAGGGAWGTRPHRALPAPPTVGHGIFRSRDAREEQALQCARAAGYRARPRARRAGGGGGRRADPRERGPSSSPLP